MNPLTSSKSEKLFATVSNKFSPPSDHSNVLDWQEELKPGGKGNVQKGNRM